MVGKRKAQGEVTCNNITGLWARQTNIHHHHWAPRLLVFTYCMGTKMHQHIFPSNALVALIDIPIHIVPAMFSLKTAGH